MIIIGTNNKGHRSLMLRTKFYQNRPSDSRKEDFLKCFTMYGHGSHLGHVTSIMLMNSH